MDLTLSPKPTPWLPWLLLTIFAVEAVAVFSLSGSVAMETGSNPAEVIFFYGVPFLLFSALLLVIAWNIIRRSVGISEGKLQVRVPLLGRQAVRTIPLSQLSSASIDAYSVSISWLEYVTLALEPRVPTDRKRRIFLPIGYGKRDPEVLAFVEALNREIRQTNGGQ